MSSMKRLFQAINKLLPHNLGRPRLTFGRVAGVISLLGLLTLTFVLGAGTMFFDLPSSSFLSKAFAGGQVWFSQNQEQVSNAEWSNTAVTTDSAGNAFEGYTLVTKTSDTGATLIDMKGNTVHQWRMNFRRNWPPAANVRDPEATAKIHWERCHLYPNGDLLALCCGDAGSPYGYGLAKLDKNSRLLWGVSANVHHDLDVGEDGRIYALSQRTHVEIPVGLKPNPEGYIADDVLVLSPEGRELDWIPIFEAFLNSPYYLVVVAESGGEGLLSMRHPIPQPQGAPPPPSGFPRLGGPGAPRSAPGPVVRSRATFSTRTA